MAAVAAEPGASAATSTTSREGADLEHEVVQPVTVEAKLKAEATAESAPVMDLLRVPKNGDAAQECSVVDHTEAQCSPVPEAVGKARCSLEEDRHVVAEKPGGSETETAPKMHETTMEGLRDLRCEDLNLNEELSLNAGTANEVSLWDLPVCCELAPGSEPAGIAAVQSLPVPPMVMQTGLAAPFLSFVEPTEPVRGCTPLVEEDFTSATEVQCDDVRALLKPPSPEPSSQPGMDSDAACADVENACSGNDAVKCPETTGRIAAVQVTEPKEEHERVSAGDLSFAADHVSSVSESDRFHPPPCDSILRESQLKPTVVGGEDQGLRTDSVAGLSPGSEVRVSLDHIIDDALVVSFRLGEKMFSGVLMDLSKRFGPYGIPVTVFPKREYRDKPESMQLKTDAVPLELELEKEQERVAPGAQPEEPPDAPSVPTPVAEPSPSQWTSKPPPLFQDGVPYPPPLFIRDTYSQSIPQPPPRKIKRPKRKLYREEPTSIMSAIRLRPRQVLCDKCKGTVVGTEKREVRRGPGADCRAEDAKRRRGDGTTGVAKRARPEPRAEERARAADGPRRQVVPVGQARGPGVAKVVVSASAGIAACPAAGSPRVQLHSKKVLQSKNVDHSKAREVLKMARAAHRRRDKGDVGPGARTPMTRASSSQDSHQKVHFTRRLHQVGRGGTGTCVTNSAPLPPRIRIRPQRYRNEENSSSACKGPGFDRGPGGAGRGAAKPGPTRCSSTRSSCSSVPTAAAAASENHSLAREFEPESRPQLLSQAQAQPQPLPHPELELSSDPRLPKEHEDSEMESEDLGGHEKQGAKAGSLAVYVSLNPSQLDSSSISVCSVDSADDLKSSNSECSSTETFDLSPPGALHLPTVPSTSSIVTASSTTPSFTSTASASKEDKKPRKPLKAAVFSKNVSKCVTADGTTMCVGDIVWAKIYGFPWWPARILVITVSRKDNGLLVRQEARISWFGSPTTSFLALSQVTPFLENFQSRFDKKRKGLYRKAIAEAAKAAKQLTPEVRALLTQFET